MVVSNVNLGAQNSTNIDQVLGQKGTDNDAYLVWGPGHPGFPRSPKTNQNHRWCPACSHISYHRICRLSSLQKNNKERSMWTSEPSKGIVRPDTNSFLLPYYLRPICCLKTLFKKLFFIITCISSFRMATYQSGKNVRLINMRQVRDHSDL